MMNWMRRFAYTVLFVAFVAITVNGCNTMKGAGRDVERAGEEIQDAAE